MLEDFDLPTIARQLYASLPTGWFPEPTWDDAPDVAITDQIAPNLKATLNTLAAGWAKTTPTGSGFYDLLRYTEKQSRLTTATGFWLDFLAMDFYAGDMPRHPRESDDRYRRRLQIDILREKGTRCALRCGVANLTGYYPDIIEPMNPGDCGAYGAVGDTVVGPSGYGTHGAYGSLKTPFQCFVTATRPLGQGIPVVNGYGMSNAGYSTLGSGIWGYYGATRPPNYGSGAYSELDQVTGDVTDLDIYRTVSQSLPAGTTAWTKIQSPTLQAPFATGLLDINFFLDITCLADPKTFPPQTISMRVPIVVKMTMVTNAIRTSAIISIDVKMVATAATLNRTISAKVPVAVKFIGVMTNRGSAISIDITTVAQMQAVSYLGTPVLPNFILGESALTPPGSLLGRSFILAASILGSNNGY